MKREERDIHGDGGQEYEIYTMPGSGWEAITDVPCPVEGCDQVLVWYEAGYVPGYRVCMKPASGGEGHLRETLRHRFILDRNAPPETWALVRDECCEGD